MSDRTPSSLPGAAELHPRLEQVLHRLQYAERTATGDQRRPTFRLMRSVLGASVALGVPLRLLADCLGTRPGSVRNRAGRPAGIVTSDMILALTDLTPTELDQLSGGALSRVEGTLPACYQTVDVVRALISTPSDRPTSPGDRPAPHGSKPPAR